MLYNCVYCKTSKSLVHPASVETAYCVTCQCLRRFLPSPSAGSVSREPVRYSTSTPTAIRTFGGSTSLVRKSTGHADDGTFGRSLEPWTHSAVGLAHSSSAATVRPCAYFELCLEYMLSLGCSKKLFNRKHNRCYCEKCYLTNNKDFYVEGGSKYVIPRGWVRFGLYVDDAQAEVENIWKKWVVSYHGTSPRAAKSIIEHHQFLLPGDQCIDGTVIRIGSSHIPNKFQVYTSPTIAYSGDDTYSPSNRFHSAAGQSYAAKIVLQCRQQPGTYRIQSETIGAGGKRLCPIIPNSEVEYFTEVRSSIIPYGLLIRVFQ